MDGITNSIVPESSTLSIPGQRIRKSLTRIAIAASLMFGVVVPISAADASETICTYGGSAGLNWTRAIDPDNYCGDSAWVRAKIVRYMGGIVTYHGSWGNTSSYISSSNGVNAGNYIQATGSGWHRLYPNLCCG